MNLQAMTIIFAIIFLPIILVTTYFIQLEVDTIRLQASYDTKLIDATTDAISAFEINTANEDLSSVSDSLRSVIEASNNVFTTTLATNLGMSSATKSKILPYIPTVVYTLYDGYYIYAPTQTPKVVTDPNGVYVKVGDNGTRGSADSLENNTFYYDYKKVKEYNEIKNPTSADDQNIKTTCSENDVNLGKILYYKNEYKKGSNGENNIECTTNPDKAYFTTNYILKSFTPYSMDYDLNGRTITINYTLDNFITVSGKDSNGIYYTKSGYLIDPSIIKSAEPEELRNKLSGNNDKDKIALDKVDEYIDSLGNSAQITVSGATIKASESSASSIDYTRF